MAVYIFLGKRTQDAARGTSGTPSRSVTGRQYSEQLGIKVLGHYATLGEYDVVTICEGPDDPHGYFKIAAFGSQDSSMTWTALPAIPMDEYYRLLKELPG